MLEKIQSLISGRFQAAAQEADANIKSPEPNYFFIGYAPLIVFLEDATAALFVQRIHYWLQKKNTGYILRDGSKWLFNGYREWQEQLEWLSVDQIGRMVRSLEAIGWIRTERFYYLKRHIGFIGTPPQFHEDNQRKWYTLDYKQIFEDTGFDLGSITYDTGAASKPQERSRRRRNNPQKQMNSKAHQEPTQTDESAKVQIPIGDFADSSSSIQNRSLSCTTTDKADNSADSSPHPPEDESYVQPPHVKGKRLRRLRFAPTLDTRTPAAHEEDDHRGVGGGMAPGTEDESLRCANPTPPSVDSVGTVVENPVDSTPTPAAGLDKSSPPRPKKPQFPYQEGLRVNSVNLHDKDLIAVALQYPERLVTAVRAFLEYCRRKRVRFPTRALITAIKDNWQPDGERAKIPEEANPPTPEQMQQLLELKRLGQIHDIFFSVLDGISKVVMPNMLQKPWWEVLPNVEPESS